MKEVEIDKFKILIARVKGQYYAISGKCMSHEERGGLMVNKKLI